MVSSSVPGSARLRSLALWSLTVLCAALSIACGSRSSGAARSGTPTKSPIKLGVLADAQGNFALGGASTRIGAILAIQEINAAGGVDGHPLQAIYVDPRGDPGESQTLAQRLVQQDGADVLVGAANSAACLAVEKLAAKLGVVYLSAGGGCATEELTATACNKYTFRVQPVGIQTLSALSQYLVKTYGKRWGVIYQDYAFGQSQVQAYQAALGKNGASITVKIPVPVGETNDTPYVTKIPTDGSIDGLVAVFGGTDNARMFGTFQQFSIGKKLPVIGVGTKDLFGGTYPEAVSGSIATTVNPSDPPAGNQYAAAFDTAYHKTAQENADIASPIGGANAVAGNTGYGSYVGIKALAAAMRASHFSGRADTAKLIAAFENLKLPKGPDSPSGETVMSKSDHQGRQDLYIFKIDGQREQILDTIPAEQLPPVGTCQV